MVTINNVLVRLKGLISSL